MKSKILIGIFISLVGMSHFAKGNDSMKINWTEGKSSVAWMTKKKMFLFKNVEPVGFNTAITVLKDVNKKTISIAIPIDKFDSGEPDRDKEVIKILKGDVQPELLFTSDAISEDLEKNLLQDQFSGKLNGELKIGRKSFKVIFNIKNGKDGQRMFIEGDLQTSFTAFEIDPPKVAGGLVAKVSDELTLAFRIYLNDIKK